MEDPHNNDGRVSLDAVEHEMTASANRAILLAGKTIHLTAAWKSENALDGRSQL
jgi:hypothetical protein